MLAHETGPLHNRRGPVAVCLLRETLVLCGTLFSDSVGDPHPAPAGLSWAGVAEWQTRMP